MIDLSSLPPGDHPGGRKVSLPDAFDLSVRTSRPCNCLYPTTIRCTCGNPRCRTPSHRLITWGCPTGCDRSTPGSPCERTAGAEAARTYVGRGRMATAAGPLALFAVGGHIVLQIVITRPPALRPRTAGDLRARVQVELSGIRAALARPGIEVGIVVALHPSGDTQPDAWAPHQHYVVVLAGVIAGGLCGCPSLSELDPRWRSRSPRSRSIPALARDIRTALGESWRDTGVYVGLHLDADREIAALDASGRRLDADAAAARLTHRIATVDRLVRREFRGFAGFSQIRRVGPHRSRHGLLASAIWRKHRQAAIDQALAACEGLGLASPFPLAPPVEQGCAECASPLGTAYDRQLAGGGHRPEAPSTPEERAAARLDDRALAGDPDAIAILVHHREAGLLPSTRRRRLAVDERVQLLRATLDRHPGDPPVIAPVDDPRHALDGLVADLHTLQSAPYDVRGLQPVLASADELIAACDAAGHRPTVWGYAAPETITVDGQPTPWVDLSVRQRLRWVSRAAAAGVQALRDRLSSSSSSSSHSHAHQEAA